MKDEQQPDLAPLKYLDAIWADIPLGVKAHIMRLHPAGLDPLRRAITETADAQRGRAEAAEQREQALREATLSADDKRHDLLVELIALVDEHRHASPNLFYARVDNIVKRARALIDGSAPAATPEPEA